MNHQWRVQRTAARSASKASRLWRSVGRLSGHAIVLACGVFGSISDADIYGTIDALPQLCRPETAVIWTRSRRDPDLTPAIRRSFTDHGFTETAFVAPKDVLFSVGVNRFTGTTQPLQADQRLFTFVPRPR